MKNTTFSLPDKMKFITAVVAFSVTFGFAAFVTTLLGANNRLSYRAIENNPTTAEISGFLQQDVDNGFEMDEVAQTSTSLPEYSNAVSDYVATSEAMEDVNLPPDFRFAWHAHMNAWRRHADFLEANLYNEDFYKKENFLTYKNQTAEIQRTWLNVLDIGKKYSAIIPENAY